MGLDHPIRTFRDLWSWSLDHIPVPETVFLAVDFSSVYQGIEFRGKGDPVLFLSNPKGVDASAREKRSLRSIN